jgi:hypothetical protein
VTHPPVATPRTRRRLGIAALAGTLVGLAGVACGSLLPPADLKPPSIAFSELAIDSIGSERVRFTVRISTRNPNPVDLPLSNVYFDLAVLGLPVALDVATADLRSVLVRLLAGPMPETVWELKGTANWGASPLPIPFQRRGDASSLRRLRELLLPRG